MRCANIPEYLLEEAASRMSGEQVYLTDDEMNLNALDWLNIFLERDSLGVRSGPEGPNRLLSILDYLRENPDSTERDIREALVEEGVIDGRSHVHGSIEKLAKEGKVYRTGERHYRGERYLAVAAFTWRVIDDR